jgi:hypothetical protein
VTAAELKVGDKVLRPDGKWTRITRIWREQTPITVYNFEVEGNHSYFAGDIGILSHNCDAAEIAKRIASTFSFGQCKQCAAALESAFKKAGVGGEVLEINLQGRGWISSYSAGTVIADNGEHQAVRVGDMVYDYLHPNGISYANWVKDFMSPQGVSIVENIRTVRKF